jgi:glutathione peroxidase
MLAPMLRSLALLALVAVACDSSPTPSTPAPAPEAAKAAPAEAKPTEAKPTAAAEGPTIDHVVETIEGGQQSLAELRGKAILIVNTASQCGFTPQYAKLQELYGRYKDRGLVVLGFPSNDFGEQEPGDAAEIKEFVASKFAIDFPMMNKVHAKGPEIAPLYKTLTEETPEGIRGEVKWNFTKFLVDPKGHVVARFESPVDPLSPEVTEAIEKVLPAAG